MEWISVKNSLPEKKEEIEYLVTDGKKVCASDYVCWYSRDNHWDWLTPSCMGAITHWMPLPEPPKENG